MDSQFGLRALGALGVVCFFALYVYVQAETGEQQRLSSPTVFSAQASGVSAFKELVEKMRPGELKVSEEAILEPRALEGLSLIMLLSPSAPPSRREASLIKDYVNEGGTLIVAFRERAVWDDLNDLRNELGLKWTVDKVQNFTNGQVSEAVAATDSAFFRGGESYAFYSNFHFAVPECVKNSFECFVKIDSLGKGKILFIAGLPPLSNGLIDRDDNQKFAFRLITSSTKILIDEYHHFFSSKTWVDLILYPPFALPVGGLVLGLLLFFILAHTEFFEQSLRVQNKVKVQSHHGLGAGILERTLSETNIKREVVTKQIEYLNNLFPDRRDDLRGLLNRMVLEGKTDPWIQSFSLIKFHQNILRQKGRKT